MRGETGRTGKLLRGGAGILLASSVIGMLYVPLLSGYFSSDDMSWIWFAATKSVGEILFSPEDYRAIGSSNFTPMLGLSFKLDWILSGIDPRGYLLHNLFAVVAAGTALFMVLRLYAGQLTAFAGAVLYLLNPVVLSVYSWSSTRHYSEGMFFALLAVYVAIRAERVGKVSAAGGILYLLAALCKEIYILLPAVIFIVCRGGFMQRVKATLPMWTGLGVYAVWRVVMLGGTGGYPFGGVTGIRDVAEGMGNSVHVLSVFLFGNFSLLFFPLIGIILITAGRKQLLQSAGIAAVLFLPIVPVLSLIDLNHSWARYFFHLSVFLTVSGLLWGNTMLRQRGWKGIMVVILLIITVPVFLLRGFHLKNLLSEGSSISRAAAEEFIFSEKPYVVSRQPVWFYDGLRDIYQYLFHRTILTKVIPEENLQSYLSEERKEEIALSGYSLPVTKAQDVRPDAIGGRMSVEGYRFTWDFDGYGDGTYLIIMGKESGLYTFGTPVKRRGTYLFGRYYPGDRPQVFYLRAVYRSPDGWEALSPEFSIEIPGDRSIRLQRNEQMGSLPDTMTGRHPLACLLFLQYHSVQEAGQYGGV
ncbi:MAG: hypothetical protein AB1552_08895 [Nitrospirota bacterium]